MQCPRFLKCALLSKLSNVNSIISCAAAVLARVVIISIMPAKIPNTGNNLFIYLMERKDALKSICQVAINSVQH